MAKQLYRIQGLKGVRDFIKAVCDAHQSNLCFRSGVNLLEDKSDDITYPLAFLETDFNSSYEGDKEIYQINLNIADYIPKDATEDDIILGISKTEQILSEIHYALKNLTTNIPIGELSKQSFRDYDDDRLVVTRGEFTLAIAKYTAKEGVPGVDLPTVPTFGGVVPKGDSEMSDESTNPVQNKVVKAYIDAEVSRKADTEHLHSEFTQLQASLDTKADKVHTHNELVSPGELTDALKAKADANHSHQEYALKTELQNIDLSSKADADHHHNDKYYTQADVDNKIIAITTNLDWQGSVATFAQLATTYPNPKQGWTVTVNADGKDYRFNGSSWIDIGNNSVPMASATVDGRMSKEHFTTVTNLPTTHYTKTEVDAVASNASNIKTGYISDARLTGNVIRRDLDATFQKSVTVNGDFTPAGFTKSMLVTSAHSNLLLAADKRYNVTVTENGVPSPLAYSTLMFNGITNSAYSFTEPSTKCPFVIEITDMPSVATSYCSLYFLGWRDGNTGGGFEDWKLEVYAFENGTSGPIAWQTVFDRTGDTTAQFPFSTPIWGSGYAYIKGIRITINKFSIQPGGRLYMTEIGLRNTAGSAPWEAVGALGATGGDVYGDLDVKGSIKSNGASIALTGHKHSASDIDSGTLAAERLPATVVRTDIENDKVQAKKVDAGEVIVNSKNGVVELSGNRYSGVISTPTESTTHLGQLETPWLSFGYCQNFLRYTEDFTQQVAPNWIRTNIVSVTANTHNTPRGVSLLSDTIVGNTPGSRLTQTTLTTTPNIGLTGWWTFSIYLKTISGTATVGLQLDSSAENGEMKYVEVSEDWRRYSVNTNFSLANTFKRVILEVGANTIVAWGAQLEPYKQANVYSGVRTTTHLTAETAISRIDASTTISGSLTATSSMTTSGALTSSRASTTLTRVDGLILQAASATTAAAPERTAPAMTFMSRVWNASENISKSLYWGMEVTPSAATQTSDLKIGYRNQDNPEYTYPMVLKHNVIEVYNDIEIKDVTKGVIMASPNGTRYRLTVNDDGTLQTTQV